MKETTRTNVYIIRMSIGTQFQQRISLWIFYILTVHRKYRMEKKEMTSAFKFIDHTHKPLCFSFDHHTDIYIHF